MLARPLALALAALTLTAAPEAQTRRRRRPRPDATQPTQPAQPAQPARPVQQHGGLQAPLVPPEEHEARPVVAPPGSVPDNPYRVATAQGRHFGRVREEEILEALAHGPVGGRLRNYGNTSVNIRVDFPGPVDGSFKPSERLHEEHWRAEIAAFRLNQLLGMERVPPSVFRRVPQDELPTGARFGVTFTDGTAHGAMIYWVPVLRPSGVGSLESLAYWSTRLAAGATLPDAERARAEEVSTLIVFDFLIANWDRWNGLNTLQDGDGRLVYRDNNGGFQVPLRASLYHRVETWLHQVHRFSRRLVAACRALDMDTLRDAMSEEGIAGGSLLTDAQMADVLRRRDTLLRYVEGLARRHGERAVLFFD